ncbi:MAG TPA: 3D domain-containing protein [Candidatus Dormibacteraeota bacterium]|nr:3D domain-containing protein [Candidatus Dormibacteraeota bacterium]
MSRTDRCHIFYIALIAIGMTLVAGGCTERSARPPEVAAIPTPTAARTQHFEATAYTIEGRTASGKETRHGIVAADPRVLPIGSRIRVTDAASYSGVYEVADTGRAIKGHEIDIYIENAAEARRFGRRSVQVEVLQLGER